MEAGKVEFPCSLSLAPRSRSVLSSRGMRQHPALASGRGAARGLLCLSLDITRGNLGMARTGEEEEEEEVERGGGWSRRLLECQDQRLWGT